MVDVREGKLTEFDLVGNARADFFAQRGASFAHAEERDVLLLEGCLALATQACKFSARLAAKMVSEDVHDHQGLEAIKLIDLTPHLCPGLGPFSYPGQVRRCRHGGRAHNEGVQKGGYA